MFLGKLMPYFFALGNLMVYSNLIKNATLFSSFAYLSPLSNKDFLVYTQPLF